MKKMLVIFLILFTTVLADSDEDKYVDLLPDEEKEQFLENVARRILKDVESQEDVTNVKSGEVDDEQLKQHAEYVKSILKEEQENIRRSKGDGKKIGDKRVSEEENLGVQPLASLKVSLYNERQDLTLREKERDAASNKDSFNMTIETVTDNAPIIKRSVQDDNADRSNGSHETTSEKINKVESGNEKSENFNSDAKTLSETGSAVVESTNAGDTKNGVNLIEGHNVSVKGIHEGLRRSNNEDSIIAGNETESTTVSTIETTQPTEITTEEYTNVSSADEEFTTVTYPFELTSAKDNDTEASTTNDPVLESTTEMATDNNTEPIMISGIDTKNETEITESVRKSTSDDQETMTSTTETTASVPEITTENVPETTVDTKIVRTETATEPTTFMITEQTVESTVPVATITEAQIVVEDFPTASTSSTVKIKTFKPKKPIELSTATPELEQSVEATTKKTIKHKVVIHKPVKYIVGPKAKTLAEKAEKNDEQNENFIELEKVFYNDKNNLNVGKEYHVFEVPAGQSPFIRDTKPMAEQPYFVPIYNYSPNNAYYNPKNRLGPNPGDSSTENMFNDDDNLNEVDRTETLNVKMEYDSLANFFDSKRKKFGGKQKYVHTPNNQPLKYKEPKVIKTTQGQVNPEDYLDSDYYFGRVRNLLLRKANEDYKFPNSDENSHPAHSIQEGSLKDHVRAVRNILFHQKSFGLLEKDKYESIERDLRMGRKRSEDKGGKTLRKGRDPVAPKLNTNDNGKKHRGKVNVENNIALDYYFGRENPKADQTNSHLQQVGYLRKKNDTQPLYVMDDTFKANVEKYIQEKGVTPATPLPQHATKAPNLDKRKDIITYLRLEERRHKSERLNANRDVGKSRYTIPNRKDISDKIKKLSAKTLDLKVNVRRNDVVKVSVYLQVLNDMVTLDNKALVQYDWLGTTVDIQASLQKLFELTSLVVNEEMVHPADMEILKYVLFLHKLASEIIEANDYGAQLRTKLALPKNRKYQKALQKEKSLINKVWLYLRHEVPEVDEDGALNQLNTFLMNVEDSLYDLHDAIKNIAKITKYKNQHWYQNLKDLYIDTDEKHLLELLLHMSALRLFSLIEESAKNGLEDDYIEYMKQNRKHCKQTLAEMMFVMELLEKYNKFVE
ncbi:hypothetical protein PYW07_011624 [Mythimna separata]|uniref:Uncharacterized protein n=1 Tax=Mythimna separata TaxID=271217 RepID=A0AAD7Y6I6_MYTSE|nr:hypothetical protein PYW07_011624 [Mythimna separata]